MLCAWERLEIEAVAFALHAVAVSKTAFVAANSTAATTAPTEQAAAILHVGDWGLA
jgi:hypothetical protein